MCCDGVVKATDPKTCTFNYKQTELEGRRKEEHTPSQGHIYALSLPSNEALTADTDAAKREKA